MKIFKTPFAATGDKIAIPTVEQPSGEVSQPTGWTPDYQLPNTDPNYKPVGRDEMNGVLYEITEALGQLQQFGFADWQNITGGWPVGANVNHGGEVWQSLANANTEEPGTGALWKPILFDNIGQANETTLGIMRIATALEAQNLANNAAALTPKGLNDSFKGSNQLLATTGYQKFPGGYIRQWVIAYASKTGATGEQEVTFPIAFPTACFSAIATDDAQSQTAFAAFATSGGATTRFGTKFYWARVDGGSGGGAGQFIYEAWGY